MSHEADWAADDAYMQAEFDKQQRAVNPYQDPEFVAYQERQFQDELAEFREDHPGASEADYVDYLLRDTER